MVEIAANSQDLNNNIVQLTNLVGDLVRQAVEFKGLIGNLVDGLDESNRSLISVGQSYTTQFKGYREQFDKLPGSIVKNFQVGIDQLILGFNKINGSVQNQLVAERLTGQNFHRTAETYRSLQLTLGLTNQQLGDLSESVQESSRVYGIQTSKLVAGLSPLGPDFLNLSLLGRDVTKLVNSITQVGASYGPGGNELVNRFIKRVLDPNSVGAYTTGIGYFREQLVNTGKFTKEQFETAFRTVEKSLERTGVRGANNNALFALESVTRALGDPELLRAAHQLYSMREFPTINQRPTSIEDLKSTVQAITEAAPDEARILAYEAVGGIFDIIKKWDGLGFIQNLYVGSVALQGIGGLLGGLTNLKQLFGGGKGLLVEEAAKDITESVVTKGGLFSRILGGAGGIGAIGTFLGGAGGLLWLIKHDIDSGVDRQVAELRKQGREFVSVQKENLDINKQILQAQNKDDHPLKDIPDLMNWRETIGKGINESINSFLFGIAKDKSTQAEAGRQQEKLLDLLQGIHNQMIQLNHTTENKGELRPQAP